MKTSPLLPLIFIAMIGILSENVESADSPASIDPGIWTSVGDMAAPRRDHVATRLGDGRVLVLGGSNLAELYDPVLQTFAPTGTTQVAHGSFATTTLLQDGSVLLVGGTNASHTAELYDPGTETFSLIDTTNAHRVAHSATLLADGRVLIAGGQDRTGPVQSHHFAEIYDPNQGTFSPTDTLIDDRNGHIAALLPNGEVLIAGGSQTTIPGAGIWLESAELYDPSGGTFRTAGNMLDNHSVPRGVLLQNGKVLIMGASRAAELYDPADSSFSPTDSLLILSSGPSVTVLQTGHVLVVGGALTGAVPIDGAQVYDPDAGEFVVVASMNEARQQQVATLLSNGDVLVTGGYGGTSNLSTAEVYTPSTTVAVELLYLSINRMGDEASLTWEVSQSAASTVFHVHRQDPGTLRQRLTHEPLTGRTRYEFIDPDAPKGGAEYWLAEIGRTGEIAWHGPAMLPPASLTVKLVLNPPTPNPFARATRITYSLPAPSQVNLAIYNLQGRRVATLVDQTQGDGDYTVGWTGEGDQGPAPAGVYFVRLNVDGTTRTRKLMFVR